MILIWSASWISEQHYSTSIVMASFRVIYYVYLYVIIESCDWCSFNFYLHLFSHSGSSISPTLNLPHKTVFIFWKIAYIWLFLTLASFCLLCVKYIRQTFPLLFLILINQQVKEKKKNFYRIILQNSFTSGCSTRNCSFIKIDFFFNY